MGLESRAVRLCAIDWLKQADTIAGPRVEGQRVTPIRPDVEGGPVLSVFTLDESAVIHTDTPRTYAVTAELIVEGFVEENPESSIGTAEERAELLEDQVFCTIEANLPQLEGVELEGREALSINPSKTGFTRRETEFDYKGRAIAGSWRLSFDVVYARSVDEVEQADVEELETTVVGWDFADPDGTVEATDDFTTSQP
jgi:hypothetical protein